MTQPRVLSPEEKARRSEGLRRAYAEGRRGRPRTIPEEVIYELIEQGLTEAAIMATLGCTRGTITAAKKKRKKYHTKKDRLPPERYEKKILQTPPLLGDVLPIGVGNVGQWKKEMATG